MSSTPEENYIESLRQLSDYIAKTISQSDAERIMRTQVVTPEVAAECQRELERGKQDNYRRRKDD